MKKIVQPPVTLFVLFALILSSSTFRSDIGNVIPDFALRNCNGQTISTKDYKNAKGMIVVFSCNHCPFAKLYSKRLNELNTRYSALNVPLLVINSMDTMVYKDEALSYMKLKAQSDSFNFPYLQDDMQTVGKLFKAQHTPTAFVIWKERDNWILKYKGSIDDNGENPVIAKPLIANAVDELLQSKPVSKPETESFGCRIFYRK
jgi:peroxiredoxin